MRPGGGAPSWQQGRNYEPLPKVVSRCLANKPFKDFPDVLFKANQTCKSMMPCIHCDARQLCKAQPWYATYNRRDDKEEGALTAVEIETKLVQQQPQPQQLLPVAKPPPMPIAQPPAPPPRAPAAMPLLSGGSSSSSGGNGRERQGPFLEATVVRVVGCDALNPASTKQYYLVLYPSGKSGATLQGWAGLRFKYFGDEKKGSSLYKTSRESAALWAFVKQARHGLSLSLPCRGTLSGPESSHKSGLLICTKLHARPLYQK